MKYIISCRSLIPSTLKHLKLRCKTINVDRSCAPWVEKAVHLEWSPTDPVVLAKCELSVAQQLQPWHGFNQVDDKAEYDSAFAVQYFRRKSAKRQSWFRCLLLSIILHGNIVNWQTDIAPPLSWSNVSRDMHVSIPIRFWEFGHMQMKNVADTMWHLMPRQICCFAPVQSQSSPVYI